jgi:Leucine Rich repeat
VRGLIALVLITGAWLGWLVRSARIQRDAVATITRADGAVKYDWGWTSGQYIPGEKPSHAGWLAKRLGVDYCGHVTDAWILGSATETQAAIEQVGSLTKLERLYLYRSTVGDDDLKALKTLTTLSQLTLGDTRITDAGLAHLAGLTRLTQLDLSGTQVSDAGLAHLKHLNKLSTLGLGHTRVTDSGLAHLKGLISLSSIGLSGTQVTDAGVQELERALPGVHVFR